MLTDLIHWLSSLHPDERVAALGMLLLVDTPRYVLSKFALCFYDAGRDFIRWARGLSPPQWTHCPSVCVIITARNEVEGVARTLESVWNSYPKLQIIVVDDGSTDGTAQKVQAFIRDKHNGVHLLIKPRHGGKASSYNYALRFTAAEIIVAMDGDSVAGNNAIWEVVQPFRDPRVGVVSAAVLARNPFDNPLTWVQAFEYLHSIFLGRLFSARLNILGIASGAMGAFRRDLLERVGGWDVGPGDDSSMTLTIRKCGYRVDFAQRAHVYTQVPRTLDHWVRQRQRWARSTIRNRCRKHVDMAAFWQRGSYPSNFLTLANVWFFQIFPAYTFWAYMTWLVLQGPHELHKILLLVYLIYLMFHFLQSLAILFYSQNFWRDAAICCSIPFAAIYQAMHRLVRFVALNQELFLRSSYHDPFYPAHVRRATWRW